MQCNGFALPRGVCGASAPICSATTKTMYLGSMSIGSMSLYMLSGLRVWHKPQHRLGACTHLGGMASLSSLGKSW